MINKKLDFDQGQKNNSLVVEPVTVIASRIALCNICQFNITLTDENDSEPHFAVSGYLKFIAENEPSNWIGENEGENMVN